MPLPRFQLFELEDLTWFPQTIRNLATDYLHFMDTRFSLHKLVVPVLRAMLENSKTSCIVDLCSGGGGPILSLYEVLLPDHDQIQFTLTDKYQFAMTQGFVDYDWKAGRVEIQGTTAHLTHLVGIPRSSRVSKSEAFDTAGSRVTLRIRRISPGVAESLPYLIELPIP
jgi:hypothetical protein